MKVELTRFRIKKGKETKAQEWMDFLNSHHEDTVATMAGERMYVENVFKEKNSDGYTYFYWYSLQGEGGQTVEESENEKLSNQPEETEETMKDILPEEEELGYDTFIDNRKDGAPEEWLLLLIMMQEI